MEMHLLYELWAGERLVLEKAFKVSQARSPNFSIGCSFWSRHGYLAIMTCHWTSDEIIVDHVVVLVGFFFVRIGANHCTLSHIGWEKCGHGLTYWPRETAAVAFP